MSQTKDDEAFTTLFIQFSNQAERWMKRALLGLVVALCLFQLALRVPELRHLLSSADKHEGVQIHRDFGGKIRP